MSNATYFSHHFLTVLLSYQIVPSMEISEKWRHKICFFHLWSFGQYPIFAGGYGNDNGLSSTEILDLDSGTLEWTKGKCNFFNKVICNSRTWKSFLFPFLNWLHSKYNFGSFLHHNWDFKLSKKNQSFEPTWEIEKNNFDIINLKNID